MTPILATYPDDLKREIDRLRRRNEYLQRRVDVLEGQERYHADKEQMNARRAAQRHGNGFAGCNND